METHTERYGDVAEVPVTVLASIGDFITSDWGENYLAGYVGAHTGGSVEHTFVYAFQVKASDGSRFAVGTTRYGEPFELKGRAWLSFLQSKGIEAHVRDVDSGPVTVCGRCDVRLIRDYGGWTHGPQNGTHVDTRHKPQPVTRTD